jgi:hypothetical protein
VQKALTLYITPSQTDDTVTTPSSPTPKATDSLLSTALDVEVPVSAACFAEALAVWVEFHRTVSLM